MATAGFEPVIPASKQSQSYALYRKTTGIVRVSLVPTQFHILTSKYFLYIENRILDSKQSPYFDRSYLLRRSFSQDIPSLGVGQKILCILYFLSSSLSLQH
jgi:hypothetical protein